MIVLRFFEKQFFLVLLLDFITKTIIVLNIMKKSRWLFYTVGVSALPVLIRLVIFIMLAHKDWNALLNAVDFVFFGLTLNLSNINELNSLKIRKKYNNILDEHQKENLVNWSIFAILMLGIILGLAYIPVPIFKEDTLLWSAIFLAIVSFFYSKSIINKINTLEHEDN